MTRPLRRLAIVVAASLLIAACESSQSPDASRSPGPGGSPKASVAASPGPQSPAASPAASPGASAAIHPSHFVAAIDNPWYPLVPGTTLRYKGSEDGEPRTEVFAVSHETIEIADVTCVVVHDNLFSRGLLIERTSDWFAQDVDGNVWYFGEDTAELDEQGNVVSTEGSWKAGVDGALPGIFMPAEPAVGQSFQQELFPNHAEDRFVILQVGVPAKVPYGSFDDAMITAEWTVLEPDVISTKTYVQGIGEVEELDVAGGTESLQLVEVDTP